MAATSGPAKKLRSCASSIAITRPPGAPVSSAAPCIPCATKRRTSASRRRIRQLGRRIRNQRLAGARADLLRRSVMLLRSVVPQVARPIARACADAVAGNRKYRPLNTRDFVIVTRFQRRRVIFLFTFQGTSRIGFLSGFRQSA